MSPLTEKKETREEFGISVVCAQTLQLLSEDNVLKVYFMRKWKKQYQVIGQFIKIVSKPLDLTSMFVKNVWDGLIKWITW
jgi:hypothetical protein